MFIHLLKEWKTARPSRQTNNFPHKNEPSNIKLKSHFKSMGHSKVVVIYLSGTFMLIVPKKQTLKFLLKHKMSLH